MPINQCQNSIMNQKAEQAMTNLLLDPKTPESTKNWIKSYQKAHTMLELAPVKPNYGQTASRTVHNTPNVSDRPTGVRIVEEGLGLTLAEQNAKEFAEKYDLDGE
jgi:hypothetical protein